MSVLLLVEGQSDRAALPILARRLAGAGVGVSALPVGRGDMFSADKVAVHIRLAVGRQRRSTFWKAVLCIDSECTEIDETKGRIDSVVADVDRRIRGVSVRAVVVDHSLEGWLLQDRSALAQYLGVPPTRLRYRDPETECRPAESMRKVFRRSRKRRNSFTKTGDLPSLAELIDTQQLARLSPTFRDFRHAIVEVCHR